jgi:hypothetical protein
MGCPLFYESISQFAESDLLDRVIVPFMENEMGAFPRGQDDIDSYDG